MAIRSPLAPTLEELAAKPTERVKIALSAPTGHLSHRERQDPHLPLRRAPSPKGRQGLRIATPVCALVRNDMRCTVAARSTTLVRNDMQYVIDTTRTIPSTPYGFSAC